MIDECSQMWLGEIVPILSCKNFLSRVILVGDQQQLPPYGATEVVEAGLDGKSLFELCLLAKYVYWCSICGSGGFSNHATTLDLTVPFVFKSEIWRKASNIV